MYLEHQGWYFDMDKITALKVCLENTHYKIYQLNKYLETLEQLYDAEVQRLREQEEQAQ